MKTRVLADTAEVPLPPASQPLRRSAFRAGTESEGFRTIAEETAVALSYGGSTHAVMMATPQDLEDFAVGFSLTERIVSSPAEIESIAVVPAAEGIDVQMWLANHRAEAHAARRRHLAGATGCGLCGVDSLSEAMRAPLTVGDTLTLDAAAIATAMSALPPYQALNARTGAVHAAALWRPGEGLAALREDVGRHNALDKLVGALARRGETGAGGVLLLTSRVSVEMVQKAAVLGAGILVAVSAPTALAIRTAEAAGITLVAIARADGFELFTHPHRIRFSASRSAGAVPASAARRSRVQARLLPVADAWQIILADVAPIGGEETVALTDGVGRAASRTIVTPHRLPRFDHSAMDGYGVHAADCGKPNLRLRLVGRILAGDSPTAPVGPGETVRLLTGAAIPSGVAAVIMEEHCDADGNAVAIDDAVTASQNIRRAGEDAEAGVSILAAGAIIGPQQVPILATCGIGEIAVRRKLRVAILSNGSELAERGDALGPASVRDVNRAMLTAIFAEPWIALDDLGIVPDHPRLLADAMRRAASSADLLITSGGVSGSDADHVASALDMAGGRGRILRIAVKPGKPMFSGALGDVPVLGLPGNPLSALAGAALFGRALLCKRAGRPLPDEAGHTAIVDAPLFRRPGRTEVMPAMIAGRTESGQSRIALMPQRGSARLYPLSSSSGLAVIPAETEAFSPGDRVVFIPFDRLWS